MPEQFLEDFKRRDIDKFLEDFRIPYYMKTFNVDEDEAIEMIMDNTYYSKEGIKRPSGRIGYEEGGMMGNQKDFNKFLEEMKKRDYGRMQEQILRDYENYMKRKKMIDQMPEAKDGGIMKMADGGMMDMGGMEMDLRGGGFVPIGEQEKADDVPARLSQNEFVFTADAVRGAGGGDVDKGADKMYKTMKELEGMVV